MKLLAATNTPLSDNDKEFVRVVLRLLKGETYIRPDQPKLGKGANNLVKRVTERLLEHDTNNDGVDTMSDEPILLMEHYTYKAWKQYRNKYLNDNNEDTDGDSSSSSTVDIQEIDEDYRVDCSNRLQFRRHKQSLRDILLTPSYFLIFAPHGKKTSPSLMQRLRLMRSFVVLLDHLEAAGCSDESHSKFVKLMFRSLAMWMHCPFRKNDDVKEEDLDEYLGNLESDHNDPNSCHLNIRHALLYCSLNRLTTD